MTLFARWLKFNLVGVVGMVLQLTTLALLNRIFPNHYLITSAIALEITLLHNFTAHLRYTWRDRRDEVPIFTQLLRFHISNGLVSLIGNLLLMKLLVNNAHLPVILSNAIAIVCCSLANFCLSHHWTFSLQTSHPNSIKASS